MRSSDAYYDSNGALKERGPLDMSNLIFQTEHWLELDSPGHLWSEQEQEPWKQNRAKAELISRALDQLGYLVREGIVPLNVVARFYSYPTLKCWYQLSPYVAAVRKSRGQIGHMWEWENLVTKIMDGTGKNEGILRTTIV
jgi:hypothetical protein